MLKFLNTLLGLLFIVTKKLFNLVLKQPALQKVKKKLLRKNLMFLQDLVRIVVGYGETGAALLSSPITQEKCKEPSKKTVEHRAGGPDV